MESINKENLEAVKKALEADKERSAWGRGVKIYAFELLESLEWYVENERPVNLSNLEKLCLNGAPNWHEYSWGGCALCYDGDIAERLCNPSELKKTKNGARRPNSREDWLDVQTRAVRQAFWKLERIIKKL